MKLLVTEGERRKIDEHFTMEVGEKVKYRVMDVDKVAAHIRDERKKAGHSEYIEIIPIQADQIKVPNRVSTFQKDPITGVLYGIVRGVDDFGNIQWQKPQLSDSLSLNIDNINDAKLWAVLRFHPEIKGSPFQKQNPYYKVYDPYDEALLQEKRLEYLRSAFDIVDKLCESSVGMVSFARHIGCDVRDNTNFKIIRSELNKEAERNPIGFVNEYQDRNRKYNEIFASGLALNIISEDVNGSFSYENISIGMTREEAIDYLKKDQNITMSIFSKIEKKDIAARNVASTVPEKPKAKPKSTNGTGQNEGSGKKTATGTGKKDE